VRLVVVGCAGSFPSADAACSAYLVQADDEAGRTWTVLLDLGNGALGPLQRYGDVAALDAIGLTHLHADHVADMAVLSVARRYRPSGALPAVPVYGPPGTAARLVELAGDDDPAASIDGQFDVRVWDPALPVALGPLLVTPVAMNHSVPCFGVRVTGPAEGDRARTVSLAYTGDTDSGPGLDALATDVDLLRAGPAQAEASREKTGPWSCAIERPPCSAARGGARHLVLTHLPAWNDPAVAEAEARSAYDGLTTLATPGARFLL
jgi:ribonuclease BN (tRNA processing enzyme)